MKQTPKILAALFLGSIVLAACSSSPSKSASNTTSTAPAHHRPTTTTTSSASASATTSTTAAAPATTTSTTVAADAPPQNETATAQVKSALTAAYLARTGLPADQVAGTVPGSVYYAYVPQTKTYWALASFEPTSSADQQTQIGMQDDGCCGIFTSTTGTSFTSTLGFLGEPCPGQIPAALFTLWQIQPSGDCP